MMQHTYPGTRHKMTHLHSSLEEAAHHIHLVAGIAKTLLPRLPHFIDIEDLIQRGFLGLLEAEEQYEGPREDFPKYARSQIRASMLQEIPEEHVGPRRLQRVTRRLDARSRKLEQSLGRAPSAVEFASAAGLTLEDYHSVISQRPVLRTGLGVREATAPDPLQIALNLNDMKVLRSAFLSISSRERRMFRLHYGAGVKLKAIGALFGVTESRVSQILSQAATQMRARLE